MNNTVEFEEWWKENSAFVPNDEATKELVRWGFVNGQAASKPANVDVSRSADKLSIHLQSVIDGLSDAVEMSEALTQITDGVIDEMPKDVTLIAHRLRG